jgi:hypothetical protein
MNIRSGKTGNGSGPYKNAVEKPFYLILLNFSLMMNGRLLSVHSNNEEKKEVHLATV